MLLSITSAPPSSGASPILRYPNWHLLLQAEEQQERKRGKKKKKINAQFHIAPKLLNFMPWEHRSRPGSAAPASPPAAVSPRRSSHFKPRKVSRASPVSKTPAQGTASPAPFLWAIQEQQHCRRLPSTPAPARDAAMASYNSELNARGFSKQGVKPFPCKLSGP